MMNYYIADIHFGHANVIKHDGRPFQTVDEMDNYIIDAWNAKVFEDDNVYIIGDFSYRNAKPVSWYANHLKGHKHFIWGNHDRLSDEDKSCFDSIDKMMHVTDTYHGAGIEICVCHYPIAEYNGYFKGHYHIYGHIHNNKNDTYEFMSKNRPRAYNAGCMLNNYMPVTFSELVRNNEIFQTE